MMRELVIGRILFACDEDTLIREFGITEDEIDDLSDLDLFEIYEEVMGVGV